MSRSVTILAAAVAILAARPAPATQPAVAAPPAAAAPEASPAVQAAAATGAFATSARLEEFLGAPFFLPMQQLWEGRGGWGGVICTPDGTFVAFQSPGGPRCKRSLDGGKTWSPEIEIGPDANGGNAIVDETTGDLLYVNTHPAWLYRSRDSGATWSREEIEVKPDGFGHIPKLEGVAAMQCGITLAFGPKRGRLIMPARVMGPKNSNATEWRPYHYSTAIWSDDRGKTWQTSHPFPVMGTGEAALAELSDGTILYNSREHMSRGNRFLARSDDGGNLWIGASRTAELPDGARGTSYGLMGGMVRLPIAGRDVLLYSNADTDGGTMPKQVGASIATAREKVTVWASFDGGRSWPVKRLVTPGPSAYSSLGVGRTGTPAAGRIAIILEGGPKGSHSAVNVASFNLAWLLDGRDVADFLPPAGGPTEPAKAAP
jgi:sialidase-1